MSENNDNTTALASIIFNTIFLCMAGFGMYLSFCDAYSYNGDKGNVLIIVLSMSLIIGICWMYNGFITNCILMLLNIFVLVIVVRNYIQLEQEFKVLYDYVNRQYCIYYSLGDINITDYGTEGIKFFLINIDEKLLIILFLFVILNIIAAAALRFHMKHLIVIPLAVLVGMELCHGKAPQLMAGFMMLSGIMGLFFNMQFKLLGGKRNFRQRKLVLKQMWSRYIIFFSVISACFAISYLCADMTKRPAFKNSGKVLRYQHDFEKKVRQAAEYVKDKMNSNGASGYLSNRAPYQTGELIMRIVTDRRPDSDIYIREYTANVYKSGRWQNDDRNSEFDEQEILSAPFNVVKNCKQINYTNRGFINDFRNGLLNIELISESEKYDSSDSVIYWADISAAERDSDISVFRAFNIDSTTNTNALLLTNRDMRDYRIEDNSEYTSYVYDKYLKVPDGLDRLKRFCDTIVTEKNTGRQCIAVKDAICKDTQYSQQLKLVPIGTDYIEYFLFDQKKGYCEHYATAGTLLMRLKGVPARYVSGYHVSRGDFRRIKDENGNKAYVAEVQDYEAHAWIEVYKEGLGWLPFDMSKEDDDEQNSDLDNQTTNIPDIETQIPNMTPTPTTAASNKPEKTEKPAKNDIDNNKASGNIASGISINIGHVLFISGIVIVLIAGLIYFLLKIGYIRLLKRLDSAETVRERIIIYSDIFNRFLMRYGIKEKSSDDRQYFDMLSDVFNEVADEKILTGYIQILQKAVFSEGEMKEEDETEFKEYIMKMLTGLYRKCGRLKKYYIHISMTAGKK